MEDVSNLGGLTMFKDFLKWALSVTAFGNCKECRMVFFEELMSAYTSGNLTWSEYIALYNIVMYNINIMSGYKTLAVS